MLAVPDGNEDQLPESVARLGWFVSYSNEPDPKYVVVVLIRGGRVVFGPTAAEIAGRIYHGLLNVDFPTHSSAAN